MSLSPRCPTYQPVAVRQIQIDSLILDSKTGEARLNGGGPSTEDIFYLFNVHPISFLAHNDAYRVRRFDSRQEVRCGHPVGQAQSRHLRRQLFAPRPRRFLGNWSFCERPSPQS